MMTGDHVRRDHHHQEGYLDAWREINRRVAEEMDRRRRPRVPVVSPLTALRAWWWRLVGHLHTERRRTDGGERDQFLRRVR